MVAADPVAQAGATLVIQNVIVIDGSGAPAIGPMDIWVEGERISRLVKHRGTGVAIGQDEAPDPAADRVIDGTGLYATPGLIDVHMHIIDTPEAPRHDYWYKLLLGSGVTTVKTFDVGAMTPEEMVAEKRRIEGSSVAAPRLFVYPIWGENADPRFFERYASTREVRKIVDEWADLGVDGIKIRERPGMHPEIFSQIADQARKRGLGLAVHIGQEGVANLNALAVAEGGATSIEHHYGYAESSFSDRTIQDLPADYVYTNEEDRFLQVAAVWQQADRRRLLGEVVDRLLGAARESDFTMVPTFAPYEKQLDPARMRALGWFREYAPPGLAQHWWPNPRRHSSVFFEWTSTKETAYHRMFHLWMEFVNEYKNRGGVVAVGSDPFGGWYSLAGFYTIRELELLQHCGFSPLEVIRAATSNGARNLGVDDLGLIRPGYLADMVLLRENPLNDLKAYYPTGLERWDRDTGEKSTVQGIKYTIKNGVVYDNAEVLQGVRESVVADSMRFPPPPS
jgi:imidazolonepropionase-like amidohydrolase